MKMHICGNEPHLYIYIIFSIFTCHCLLVETSRLCFKPVCSPFNSFLPWQTCSLQWVSFVMFQLLNSGRAGNSVHHLQFFFFCPDKLSEIAWLQQFLFLMFQFIWYVQAAIFTTATIITLSIILIIWAQKWFLRQGEQGWMIGCLSADEGFRRQLVMLMMADRFSSSCNHSGNAYASVYQRASSIDCCLSWVGYSIFLRGWEQLTVSSGKLPIQRLQIEFHKLQRKNPYR